MDYRIITTAPGTTIETIQPAPQRVVHAEDERGVLQSILTFGWTHETATAWAHTEGNRLPDGTRIAIDRRRGAAMYQPHRRYVVEDGVTRRTDR